MSQLYPSTEEMEARTVRFKGLGDFHSLHEAKAGIPGAVFDKFAPNHVFPLLIPEAYTGRAAGAPLRGLPGLVVDLTICPPKSGPVLHRHGLTTENFMCLTGSFRIRWGEHGEGETVLSQYDFCSVPPGVLRTFENLGDEPAWLLVIIQIPTEEQSDDVVLGRQVAVDVGREFGEDMVGRLESIGFCFDKVAG